MPIFGSEASCMFERYRIKMLLYSCMVLPAFDMEDACCTARQSFRSSRLGRGQSASSSSRWLTVRMYLGHTCACCIVGYTKLVTRMQSYRFIHRCGRVIARIVSVEACNGVGPGTWASWSEEEFPELQPSWVSWPVARCFHQNQDVRL